MILFDCPDDLINLTTGSEVRYSGRITSIRGPFMARNVFSVDSTGEFAVNPKTLPSRPLKLEHCSTQSCTVAFVYEFTTTSPPEIKARYPNKRVFPLSVGAIHRMLRARCTITTRNFFLTMKNVTVRKISHHARHSSQPCHFFMQDFA